MAMMDVMGPLYCPDCPPRFSSGEGRITGKKLPKRRLNSQLVCSSSNYSGTGADMAYCPDCGHGFCVSYKVDTIERSEAWDRDSKAEKLGEIEHATMMIAEYEKCAQEMREQLVRHQAEFTKEFGDQ